MCKMHSIVFNPNLIKINNLYWFILIEINPNLVYLAYDNGNELMTNK